jgi:hypothetical protein
MSWLLAWLLFNALFGVWRLSVALHDDLID